VPPIRGTPVPDADTEAEGVVGETAALSQAANINISATAANRIEVAPTIRGEPNAARVSFAAYWQSPKTSI
jgi:hypothetical protein